MSEAAMLNWVLFLPVVGMAALVLIPRSREDWVRGLTLVFMVLQFILVLQLYLQFDAGVAGLQFETRVPWIADWGVYYHVGLDGLNILLVLLTAFLGPLVVAGAFSAVTKDV
jgi:NADH-quinone oxidoreductase subunit M